MYLGESASDCRRRQGLGATMPTSSVTKAIYDRLLSITAPAPAPAPVIVPAPVTDAPAPVIAPALSPQQQATIQAEALVTALQRPLSPEIPYLPTMPTPAMPQLQPMPGPQAPYGMMTETATEPAPKADNGVLPWIIGGGLLLLLL
ncbi:MAG: hypothetical protein ACREUY_01140 [Burkholderiales bacterium]